MCKSPKALPGVDVTPKAEVRTTRSKFSNGSIEARPARGPYLDPARHEVVRGGEYELLGAGGLWGSQDHLPSASSIWAGQDELLLGGSRGVHCGDYLDLLSRLLVCHNLQDNTVVGPVTWRWHSSGD